MARIRAPIVTVLGHVDHGKTTLLDKIRGTSITKAEPGLITQHISSSFVPVRVIEKLAGNMLEKLGVKLTIPGLLFIDSPGHEAFTTLRKRGGAIADIAILVIDINEGFRPQTEESLNFLKQFRTPFVVAMTKIDRLWGWSPKKDSPFNAAFKEQPDRTQDEFEEKLYRIAAQLGQKGFAAERYDRVSDYAKQIAIVPVSGVTGEGIPDLLMTLAGIAQKYLKKGLEVREGEGKATVLEVKEFKGLGTTIDVILYDGEIRKDDYIVIGGKETTKTSVRAILEPSEMKDIRTEKNFRNIDCIAAAAGVKISAPNMEGVVAGSPLRAVRSKKDIGKAEKEIEKEIEEVEIKTEGDGYILRADSLGSLEALIKTFSGLGIPIRKAVVGNVTKADISEIKALKNRIIFAFCVKITPDIRKSAEDNGVELFDSDVIYTLIESYKKWVSDRKSRAEEEILDSIPRPGRIRVLHGYVFRQARPAVFGVEVLKGTIRTGYSLMARGKIAGEIKEIQYEGESKKEAKKGDRVALSIQGVVIGKDFKEGDILEVFLSRDSREKLKLLISRLRQDEAELLHEEANQE